MTAIGRNALARWQPAWAGRQALSVLVTTSLFVLIGIELAVLVTVLPDTLKQWWTASSTGDFRLFYNAAENLDVNGLYSPALSLIMYPLSWLSIQDAYRVYVLLGMAALVAVAYLAQRMVSMPAAKVAVALAVVSIPQMHWALRLGHLTTFLALAALAGFLLVRRYPLAAGLCFALLFLKPQYAPIPVLYLLWTRNGQALAAMALGVLVIEVAGFAAVGFSSIGPYIGTFFDLAGDSRDDILPAHQSWQYAWQGFLLSANLTSNAVIVIALSLLSFGVVALTWARGSRTVAPVAAAVGMLIVSPYANFYDWGLLVVAGALLVGADLRWKPLAPLMVGALYLGLLAANQATPFPPPLLGGFIEADGVISGVLARDVQNPADGVYWITPMALGAVALLAFVGSKNTQPTDSLPKSTKSKSDLEVQRMPGHSLRPLSWLGLAAVVVPLAYVLSAFYGGTPPFTRPEFSPSEVERKVPADFPLPAGATLLDAGKNESSSFYIAWKSDAPVEDIAPLYEELLAGPRWRLISEDDPDPAYRIGLAKFSVSGFWTHWATLEVSESGGGSVISLGFSESRLLEVISDTEPDSQ